MKWRRMQVTKEEFFSDEYRNGMKEETFAIKVYTELHTMYLNKTEKIKTEFGKFWKKDIGVYMTDSVFEYLYQNQPILTTDKLIAQVYSGVEIVSLKYLIKTLVALEFDLWLIERYKEEKELKLEYFSNFISKKYGEFVDKQYMFFKRYDLFNIRCFDEIAQKLAPYYDKILEFYDKLATANKMRITIDDTSASRTNDYTESLTSETDNTVVPKKETDKDEQTEKTDAIVDISALEKEIRTKLDRETQIIINEKQERIEKLEMDIKEFKRQRDEAKEYSINQYDKGVKDLFILMNDVRYGKVIDYLYSLTMQEGMDENLLSYLENFFMLLEDMEIEPIAEYDESIDETNITKTYNLDFDKNDYISGNAKIKYVGWKYKDVPMEKPTLTLIDKK